MVKVAQDAREGAARRESVSARSNGTERPYFAYLFDLAWCASSKTRSEICSIWMKPCASESKSS